MILLNAIQSRELDRISQDKYGIPSYSLMTRAGETVADALVDRFPDAVTDVLVVAGKGKLPTARGRRVSPSSAGIENVIFIH